MFIDMENFNFVHFSGGEVHLNGKDFFEGMESSTLHSVNDSNDVIWAPIRNSVNLMELLILTDAYRREYGKTPEVCIPYIPYARQDRVANAGESLSIKVFADIINAQNYPKVYVMDPHSEVAMALLNNVKVLTPINDNYLRTIITDYDNKVVVAPDAGSYKRLSKVIKDVPLIYATKQRDTRTGALSNVELHVGDVNITNKTLVVVDDICDGGGTFLLLTKALQDNNIYNNIELYVTHGIFSKGLLELNKAYTKVYTTNSFYNTIGEDIYVHDLKQYLYSRSLMAV